ncbi:amidohydrolase family protein [Acuticoccus sp.]|uniref:metal-dependent hydrolase family protein n=1 Tax=Acuticoccus sp. TaxID=1904378 RepID=UPI003B516F3E
MMALRALRAATLPLALAALVSGPLSAQEEGAASILFENVRIFNGTDAELSPPSNVLVRGNVIDSISTDPIVTDDGTRTTVIAGDGRTLMPGLIDAHVHIVMSTIPIAAMMTADPNYVAIISGQAAEGMLMRGFTSVRDLAGPTFGVKRAIDEGIIPGPRVWPSGAMISQTSGHADYRTVHDIPRGTSDPLHFTERLGFAAIADGRAEMLRRVREQLMQGASQIKLAAGGGVASDYDPLDVSQFTEDELRAAVEAAEDWGTYVTVHAYTPDAVQTAIRAGVKVIDHGQLLDEETVRMMADRGIWWSMQPFLDDEDSIPFPEGSANRFKQLEMTAGTDNAYELAKEYGVKLAWGTDTLFDPQLATRQAAQLAKMVRWFEPAEVLKMATHDNAQLLALSGNRSPYEGELGVVKEGALADLLLVGGDPLADIDLIADESNIAVIMKDGQLFKNADAE